MSEYRATEVKQFARNLHGTTPEARWWKKFKFPILAKQFAAVTHIDFSPVKPFDFAISSSTRVMVYNAETNAVRRTLSRFKNVAYGGSFRKDGKLIVAGGEDALIQVFDLQTRAVLRSFRGHEKAVHRARFANDNVHVASASDDQTVRLWDLSTAQQLSMWAQHQDYVRCLCPSPVADAIWASGSYDHTVKLWDCRADQACIMTMQHGAPLEAILLFPGAGLLASAGGDTLKIWDILGGGRLLHSAQAAQKTITSLCLDGAGERLLTGSLDGHVRVHDVTTYKVLHNMKYSGPVLSCGISANSSHLVVGLSTGMLSIRQKSSRTTLGSTHDAAAASGGLNDSDAHGKSDRANSAALLHGGTYRYFLRGKNLLPAMQDHIVERGKKARLKDYDLYLKKFQAKDALDAALNAGRPVIGVSLMEELARRDGLRIALSGRDEAGLEPLLTFVNKHITNPRYSSLLIDVANMIFDIYASVLGQSIVIDTLFVQLRTKLSAELQFQQHLFRLLGTMELVLAAGARPAPSE